MAKPKKTKRYSIVKVLIKKLIFYTNLISNVAWKC